MNKDTIGIDISKDTPDLDLLTRFLMAHPPHNRTALTFGLLDQADIADRYRKRTGRRHPVHGEGSVHTLALAGDRVVAAAFCHAGYLDGMATLLAAIRDWRARRNRHHLS
jgi:hypothetical protein